MTSPSDIKPLSPREETIQESREDRLFKRVFLSPAVIILLVLSIAPLVWSLGVSLTNCERTSVQGDTGHTIVGDVLCLGTSASLSLQNYARVPTDDRLINAAKNTLFYVIFGVGMQFVIGFALALMLHQEIVGRRFFRLVFLLPMMVTPVAAGYIGRMMLDPGISPLAQLERTLSTFLSSIAGQKIPVAIPFLTDTNVAPFSIILMDSWQWIPFMILLLLAGMQAIPDDIYEAARVDGATPRQQVFRITFPILLPISVTAILIRSLEMFKIIDVINVTTGGGPGTSTESLVMYVYDTALNFGNYSYAAAIGIVLLILVIVFATIYLVISRRLTRRVLGS